MSEIAPQLAQTFVSIASDIALVIDDQGVIRNVAVGSDPLSGSTHEWVGKAWADTVSGDTQRKVELLLNEARAGGVTQRREVNHLDAGGQDIPVAYAAVRLGQRGPVLAVGRDLRTVVAIQQRFIEAQKEMERDYWRQRQAEARYRMLFQVATDGVLVVDATNLTVVEANRAAGELFGRTIAGWAGGSALQGVDSLSRVAVEELLVAARTSGRPSEIRALLAPRDGALRGVPVSVDISATPFSADGVRLLLVRARHANATGEPGAPGQRLADFVERTPDAVAITDSQGRVLMANPAFESLRMDTAQGAGVQRADSAGRALHELLVDPSGRINALLTEARRQGIVERRALALGGTGSAAVELEVSAALLAEGDQECLGLTFRRLSQRPATLPPQVVQLASAIDRLAVQVGLISLPELLRETSALTERHLIETALARSTGDQAQAAGLLGIAADDLQQRMRHHGLDVGGMAARLPGHPD
jgi:transcriptional regulator PpsR